MSDRVNTIDFKTDSTLAKANPITNGGSAFGITYLRRGGRSENV